MMKKVPVCHRTNCQLTDEVIKLHDCGYMFDFGIINNPTLMCMQDNAIYLSTEVYVSIVTQIFDFNNHTYKYIHTVETASGVRGLLIIEGIYGCKNTRYNWTSENFAMMRNTPD